MHITDLEWKSDGRKPAEGINFNHCQTRHSTVMMAVSVIITGANGSKLYHNFQNYSLPFLIKKIMTFKQVTILCCSRNRPQITQMIQKLIN